MVRTQIQLQEEQVVLLKRWAADRHTSMAEMIRQAVDMFAEAQGAGTDKKARQRAASAAGRFRTGVGDLSVRHDDYLVKTFSR